LPREASDHWTSLQFPTPSELQALMAQRQSTFAPQVRWKYSNLAYGVAGQVVEQLSGQPFARYAQAHILGPLGMHDSSYDLDVPGLATPYGRRLPDGTRVNFPFVDARALAAATGLTSTLEDMAKFVAAQFRRGPRGGTQILSSGSFRELHRVRSVDENWSVGTGLGFLTSRINNKSFVGHGGGYPGYTTQTLFHLGDKLGVIVLTNSTDSGVNDIARQALAAFGPPVAKLAAAGAATAAWDPAWARFQGLYRSRGGDGFVVMLNQRLVLLGATAAGIEAATRLEPLGHGRFRLDSATGGPPVGEVVYFLEDSGKPMRMVVGDNTSERIAAP
jgi:CubicO group peptidase (beta-lactamase class C family)